MCDVNNLECMKCGKPGNINTLGVPEGQYLLNAWLCLECYDVYFRELKKFNKKFIEAKRAKKKNSNDVPGIPGT